MDVDVNLFQKQDKDEEKADRGNIYIPEEKEEIELAEFKKGKEGSSKKDWEKYQEMPLKEKRKLYKCRNNFIKLKDIETWPDYFQERGYYFTHKLKPSMKSDKPVDKNINGKVSLWKGDITTLEIDAIVNAANNSLLGGGGVDGCIHRAAGPTLKEECRTKGGCKTGDAKITSGHKLPAKYVIHTVGPIGKHEKDLQSCYEKCLELTLENNIKTLAFCCISTGIYGYPNEDAAKVALSTTRNWLENNSDAVDRIIFCLFLDKDIKIYETLMFKYFPPGKLNIRDKPSEEKETSKAEDQDKPRKADKPEGNKLHRKSSEKDSDSDRDSESDPKKLRVENRDENKRGDDDRSKVSVQSEKEMSEGKMQTEGGGADIIKDERTKTVEEVQNGRDTVKEISFDETHQDQKSAFEKMSVNETLQEKSVESTNLEQEQTDNECGIDVIMRSEDEEQIIEDQMSEGKNIEVDEVEGEEHQQAQETEKQIEKEDEETGNTGGQIGENQLEDPKMSAQNVKEGTPSELKMTNV